MRRWVAPLLLAAACGTGAEAGPEAMALQPLGVGDRWVYRVSDADGSGEAEKTTRVVGVETLDGHEAAVLETVRGDVVVRVWLARIGGEILRLREERSEGGAVVERRRFVPGSLRTPAQLDGLKVGVEFAAPYTEEVLAADGGLIARRERSATWTVESLDDAVRTPSGAYSALRLRKRYEDGTADKLVWYAPGVGKVQERGGQIELLQAYEVGGDR